MKNIQAFFERVRAWILGVWQRTEKQDRVRYGVIAGIAFVLLLGSLFMLNSGKYQVLADHLNKEALGKVTPVLDEQKIKYKTDAAGTSVLVNKTDYAKANAALVQATDVPSDVASSYSIYQLGAGIMSTDADKRFYEKSQLEENLKSILKSMDGVQDASVIVNIPDQKSVLFKGEEKPVTASVQIKFRDDFEVNKDIVASIQDFVAKAANIDPQNLVLLDGKTGTTLIPGDDDDNTIISEEIKMKQEYDKAVAAQIKNLLDPVVGAEHVTVSVNAVLDFDEKTTEGIEFTAPVDGEGIPRSMQTIYEEAVGRKPSTGEPGVDENGAGDTYAAESDNLSTYKNTSETVNYEINQLTTNIKQAKGKLIDITAAIVVDENVFVDPSADPNAAQTQNAADPALFQSVVAGCIGLPQSEYTKISVGITPFKQLKQEDEKLKEYEKQLARNNLFELIKTILLYLLVAGSIVLLVWRTLSLFAPVKEPEPEPDLELALAEGIEPGSIEARILGGEQIEITKTTSFERVEEFINNNPEAVASMIRAWMSGDEGETWG